MSNKQALRRDPNFTWLMSGGVISALGDRKNTVKQAFVLSIGMSVIAVVVFWWALQLQLPLFRWG